MVIAILQRKEEQQDYKFVTNVHDRLISSDVVF